MNNNDKNGTFVEKIVLDLEEIKQLNNDIFKEKENERKR